MFHFFRKKWQYLHKGLVSMGVASILLVTIGSATFVIQKRDNLTPIQIKTVQTEHRLRVSLAVTPGQHAKGLMWVTGLRRDGGMLFIYEKPEIVSFWMKNMNIPLDLIFIGEDLMIKTIYSEAYPCLEGAVCPRYVSKEPIKYVLEVNAGYTKSHQIGVGDKLILN